MRLTTSYTRKVPVREIVVRLAKNKVGREVPFTSRGYRGLRAALERREGDGHRVPDLVFPELVKYSRAGEPVLRGAQRNRYNAAKKTVGLPSLRPPRRLGWRSCIVGWDRDRSRHG